MKSSLLWPLIIASIMSPTARAVGFFDICAQYLGSGPQKFEIVDEPYLSSHEDTEPNPKLTPQLQSELKKERDERAVRRFDYSKATAAEVEAYGARVGISYTPGDDLNSLVRNAQSKRPIPHAFVPSSLRSGGDAFNVFAPGPLTHANVDERSVEHLFFRANQVEDPKLRSVFSKVVTFGHGGTGVLISKTGLILTAEHVLKSLENQHGRHYAKMRGLSTNSIYLQNNEFGKGQWKRIDLGPEFENFDLAVIQIPQLAGQIPVPLAQELPKPSETIFAIGYPIIEGFESQSIERPMLSVGRTFTYREEPNPQLESNVEVRPGNSGGPLLNERGEIVGIVVSGGRSIFTTNAMGEPLPILRKLWNSLNDRNLLHPQQP